MKCAVCKAKITDENRNKYKGGVPLPYCKACVEAYQDRMDRAAAKLSKMSKAKLAAVRAKLRQMGHTEEDIDKGWQAMGVKNDAKQQHKAEQGARNKQS